VTPAQTEITVPLFLGGIHAGVVRGGGKTKGCVKKIRNLYLIEKCGNLGLPIAGRKRGQPKNSALTAVKQTKGSRVAKGGKKMESRKN